MIFQLFFILLSAILLNTFFIKGLRLYLRAKFVFKSDQIIYIFKPLTHRLKFFRKQAQQFGHSQKLYIQLVNKKPNCKIIIQHYFLYTNILLLDPQMIKSLSYQHNLNTQKIKFVIFGQQIYQGLVHSNGQRWKKARKIMSNLFHFDILKQRINIISKMVQKQIESIQKKYQSENSQQLKKQKLNILQLNSHLTGQIIIQSLMGKQFSDLRFQTFTPYQQIQIIARKIQQHSFTFFYLIRFQLFGRITADSPFILANQIPTRTRVLRFKKICQQFLENKKALYQQSKKKGIKIDHQIVTPFLQAFFDAQIPNLYQQIIQQIIIFLIAGQDTTAISLTFALHLLGEHQQFQQKLRQNLDNQQDIHQNILLNNFIKQTLRLYTPVYTTIYRKVSKPFQINGYKFFKNQRVQAALSLLMRNPKYYEQPQLFNPDRFQKKQQPFTFLPFYSGPRNCIGQHMALIQMRICISEILKKYCIVRTEERLVVLSNISMNLPQKSELVKFKRMN